MIMHVVDRAARARLVERVVVATDDPAIAEAVRFHGGEAVLTSPNARSGTDRVAEAARGLKSDIIVNVQGDEPLIDPSTIDAAIEPLLSSPNILISTTSEPITDACDVFDPNVVKVVTDSDGFALMFSRSPIPYIRADDGSTLQATLENDGSGLLSNFRKHSGLYVYRYGFLRKFAGLEPSPLEKLEALEQLRALENGYRIRVVSVSHRSIGVDTRQDYEKVKRIIEETVI
jgi:3-deoxy-manno-octulosonate cytidylyltransferase (CMP-KDO synthetase)